ncbi:MAG: hypothetical protein GY808_08230 [Gammaproteobacteria bacterium]|nr:hypothetical protein [Gammaproteobacteria bacterium]
MKAILKRFENSRIDPFQLTKLLVYSLLLINYVLYIRDDWEIAAYTMRNGGDFLDWTGAFATTIDESAWIILIFLFELETCILSDEPLSRPKAILLHGTRIICYFSLAHSMYAFGIYVYELYAVTPIADINNLCQLIGQDITYASNLLYTEIDSENCRDLSVATQFYYIDAPENLIVNDSAGLVIEKELAWIDVFEVVVWLLILATIVVTVWLQEWGVASGMIIKGLNLSKFALYLLLWGAIFYWIYRGHWMFAWDEFVWIAGFITIEKNVSDWREEINETAQDSL